MGNGLIHEDHMLVQSARQALASTIQRPYHPSGGCRAGVVEVAAVIGGVASRVRISPEIEGVEPAPVHRVAAAV
jgi:hypothetical protein